MSSRKTRTSPSISKVSGTIQMLSTGTLNQWHSTPRYRGSSRIQGSSDSENILGMSVAGINKLIASDELVQLCNACMTRPLFRMSANLFMRVRRSALTNLLRKSDLCAERRNRATRIWERLKHLHSSSYCADLSNRLSDWLAENTNLKPWSSIARRWRACLCWKTCN